MALNGISSDNATIQPGQKLRLPSSSSYVDKPANNEQQEREKPIWTPDHTPRRIIEPNPNDRNNRGGAASGPNKSGPLVPPGNTRRNYKPDINNRYPSQYNQLSSQYNQLVDDSIDDFE